MTLAINHKDIIKIVHKVSCNVSDMRHSSTEKILTAGRSAKV